MSIIDRSNPINLQFRVAIVTSASSPLGVIICKTLLKANAFVVGIDSRRKDDSLNSGIGTHFQFVQSDVIDDSFITKLPELSRKNFVGREGVHILVNVLEEGSKQDLEGVKSLTHTVAKMMQEARSGTIVNVVEDESKPHSISTFTKEVADKYGKANVRCNIVGPKSSGGRRQLEDYEDAKSHMKEIMTSQSNFNTAETSKRGLPKHYDMANLTLFLAGDMSEDIAASTVNLDGSYD